MLYLVDFSTIISDSRVEIFSSSSFLLSASLGPQDAAMDRTRHMPTYVNNEFRIFIIMVVCVERLLMSRIIKICRFV